MVSAPPTRETAIHAAADLVGARLTLPKPNVTAQSRAALAENKSLDSLTVLA